MTPCPPGFPYAMEIRNPAILTPRYREIRHAHGVAHTYNHWTGMPPLLMQHHLLGKTLHSPLPRDAPTLHGLAYATAVERYAPYNGIRLPQPQMRREAATLIHDASSHGVLPYVLVNNRAEGHASLTIQAIIEHITALPN